MKIKELREKSNIELNALVEGSREAVQALRFKVASRELSNVRDIRKAKKMIARSLTLLSEKK